MQAIAITPTSQSDLNPMASLVFCASLLQYLAAFREKTAIFS